MERTFETEVLSRLAVIESKLDDYNKIKEKSDVAYNQSNNNKLDIQEINDKIKWLTRTITGAIISGIVGIIFILIKLGIGVK